jgi:hypothetical protein
MVYLLISRFLPLRVLLLLCALVVAWCVNNKTIHAQQTIVNLPSADQTPAGHFFFLHESQVRTWSPETFWNATNFLTYGVTNSFELCFTTYNLEIAGDAPRKPYSAAGIGYKTAQPLFEDALARAGLTELEPKLTFGQMLTVSLDGLGAGLWSYAHLSFRLPVLRTRLAAGLNMGSRQVFGGVSRQFITTENLNFIASIEHPITKEFGIVAEWFAGVHEMGDLVPGLVYHNKELELVLILGYKISNESMGFGEGFGSTIGRRGNGIIFEIGKTF